MPVRALARVDVGAIERNAARLKAACAPRTELCAVVKAGGYGHGALAAARAAHDGGGAGRARPPPPAAEAGGAAWLAVATAQEAAELRAGGIAGTVVVLGALSAEELDVAVAARADVVAWREDVADAVAARAGGGEAVGVHVKLDTGMGRLGTRDPAEATRVAERVAAAPGLRLAGLLTHFATADDRGDRFFEQQLERFAAWAPPLRERHRGAALH